jgi:hypothetical protein
MRPAQLHSSRLQPCARPHVGHVRIVHIVPGLLQIALPVGRQERPALLQRVRVRTTASAYLAALPAHLVLSQARPCVKPLVVVAKATPIVLVFPLPAPQITSRVQPPADRQLGHVPRLLTVQATVMSAQEPFYPTARCATMLRCRVMRLNPSATG